MEIFTLQINKKSYSIETVADTPLLWVLRDMLGLTGTKFSCGMGLCGSCTVLVDSEPARSCITPVSAVTGKAIMTIEGLSSDDSHPVQVAWLEGHVTQCGYCQPGQIMNAVVLLKKITDPSDAEIDQAMRNVLCRCGTYQRIREAIHTAAKAGA